MKVKCINDKSGTFFDETLVEGNIYQVIGQSANGSDYHLLGFKASWSKTRFVILDEEAVSTTAVKKDYGNQCPCGVHPSVCIYHK